MEGGAVGEAQLAAADHGRDGPVRVEDLRAGQGTGTGTRSDCLSVSSHCPAIVRIFSLPCDCPYLFTVPRLSVSFHCPAIVLIFSLSRDCPYLFTVPRLSVSFSCPATAATDPCELKARQPPPAGARAGYGRAPRFLAELTAAGSGPGPGTSGSGYPIEGTKALSSLGFWVQGSGFRVSGGGLRSAAGAGRVRGAPTRLRLGSALLERS